MGLQAIEAGPEFRSPVFLVDQDTGDMTTAHWAVSRGVSFQTVGASIALSPAHWLPESKTIESARGKGRVVARASVAVAACVLWLFIGAASDSALCGESDTRAQGKAELAPQSAPAAARERKQALEQEWFTRALTSSLRGELDEVRSAADAEIKQNQALDQERVRADNLARELTSLRAELDAARMAGPEVAQAAEAEIKQKQALEQQRNQERDRADALARELTSLRAELDAARIAGREVAQAAEAEIKQKQALEPQRNQERDRADNLARELTSLRAELDTARAAGLETAQTTVAAKIEQEQAFGKEREKTETLARELAAARKEAETRSALLAAAHAEALQVTEANNANTAEHERALTSERDRADALARELTSARNELQAGNRQIAALNYLRALHSRASAVDRSQERMAKSSSGAIEVKGRLPEQIFGKAAAFTSRPSSVSELPRLEAPSAAREAASDLVPKVAIGTERSTAPRTVSLPLADEQRLLARATALLGQADISGARPLLQHAVERGSARAAFMLAETYDARVLQSWRANGISGDRTKARELYERAQAGGIEDAKERIEALK